MQFIAITRRRTEKYSDAEFETLIEAEREHARRMYADNALRQIWHRADVGGAVLLFEAESIEKVREYVEHLPLAAAGMLEISTIVPLKPYQGFGPRNI